MGGGGYSYVRDVKTKMGYSNYSKEKVFKQREINPEMDIRGKIRECRDSEEHPETLPIIIALDVTGSMGTIPHKLITGGFPEIMKKIMDEGIKHPQVCFVGIGDQYSDKAPIQVGQFEASDELLDKWLKTIWLEAGGGGNGGESYQLAWWFALNHVDADHIKKRGKGILITIGNEAVHRSIGFNEIENIFGDKDMPTLSVSTILEEVKKQWHVYHINLMDYMGSMSHTQDVWESLLGGNLINTENIKGDDIPDIIAGIILQCAGESSKPVKEDSPVKETTHLR